MAAGGDPGLGESRSDDVESGLGWALPWPAGTLNRAEHTDTGTTPAHTGVRTQATASSDPTLTEKTLRAESRVQSHHQSGCFGQP